MLSGRDRDRWQKVDWDDRKPDVPAHPIDTKHIPHSTSTSDVREQYIYRTSGTGNEVGTSDIFIVAKLRRWKARFACSPDRHEHIRHSTFTSDVREQYIYRTSNLFIESPRATCLPTNSKTSVLHEKVLWIYNKLNSGDRCRSRWAMAADIDLAPLSASFRPHWWAWFGATLGFISERHLNAILTGKSWIHSVDWLSHHDIPRTEKFGRLRYSLMASAVSCVFARPSCKSIYSVLHEPSAPQSAPCAPLHANSS